MKDADDVTGVSDGGNGAVCNKASSEVVSSDVIRNIYDAYSNLACTTSQAKIAVDSTWDSFPTNRAAGLQAANSEQSMNTMTLETHINRLANKVKSGRSVREDVVIDNRLTNGDVIAQGDVLLTYSGESAEMANMKPVTERQRLVPGTDDGGKHFLVGGPGVFATETPTDETVLIGPMIFVAAGSTATIVHDGSGCHGPVTIAGPAAVQVKYPREWDKMQRAERRARD